MTNLAISINNAPAVATTTQPGKANSNSTANEQDFGNVLARQVSDSDKSAGQNSRSSKNESKPMSETEQPEAPAVAEPATSIPPDMLAALMAQQNPALVAPVIYTMTALPAPPEVNPVQPELKAALTDNALTAAEQALQGASQFNGAELGTPTSLTDQSRSTNFLAELITPQPKAENIMASVTTAKTMGLKEAEFDGKNPQPHALDLNQTLPGNFSPAGSQPTITALPNTSSATISTAVSLPNWGDEFSQQVTWMATQRHQSAELHLNPPQLGPLDVVLKMHGDQASAIFSSPHAAVREAIEQALPKLREMLAESGIMLSNAMVNDQTSKNPQDQLASNPQSKNPNIAPQASTETAIDQPLVIASRARHQGMVDTFA